jgi:hypothetical protein
MVSLSSYREKLCVGCYASYPWELDEGQKPLINSSRGDRKRVRKNNWPPTPGGICKRWAFCPRKAPMKLKTVLAIVLAVVCLACPPLWYLAGLKSL